MSNMRVAANIKFNFFSTLSLIVLIFGSLSLRTHAGENINLRFYLSESFSAEKGAWSLIREMVNEAQACINEALRAGEAGWNVQLVVESEQSLSAEEEAGISANVAYSYHRESGAQDAPFVSTKLGSETQDFKIVISNEVTFSHVSAHLNSDVIGYYEEGASRRQDIEQEIFDKCETGQCELTESGMYIPPGSPVYDLMQELNDISERFDLLRKMNPSNRVYLSLHQLRDMSLGTKGSLLAHELMHAWGGLDDEYSDEGFVPGNLMGDLTCRMSSDQVSKIEESRNLYQICPDRKSQ